MYQPFRILDLHRFMCSKHIAKSYNIKVPNTIYNPISMTKEFDNKTVINTQYELRERNFHCINKNKREITTDSLSVEMSPPKQGLASKASTCLPYAHPRLGQSFGVVA